MPQLINPLHEVKKVKDDAFFEMKLLEASVQIKALQKEVETLKQDRRQLDIMLDQSLKSLDF